MVASHAERLAAYEATKSDPQAAKLVGLHLTTFRVWRVMHGLPPKHAPHRKLTAEDHARRLEAWAASTDNSDAARRVGTTPAAFETWALKHGLHSNQNYQDPATSDKHERYLHAYFESRSDAEAARLLKVSKLAVSRWRRRNGLPSTALTNRKRMAERKVIEKARRGR